MSKEIIEAVEMLEREKGISGEDLLTALEDALLAAYKKTPDAVSTRRCTTEPRKALHTLANGRMREPLRARHRQRCCQRGAALGYARGVPVRADFESAPAPTTWPEVSCVTSRSCSRRSSAS